MGGSLDFLLLAMRLSDRSPPSAAQTRDQSSVYIDGGGITAVLGSEII